MRLFDKSKRKQRKEFTALAKTGEIEPVFKSGGVTYYRFVNVQNIPIRRFYEYLDALADLEMKVDSRMLDAFQVAFDKALKDGDLKTAFVLNDELRDKRKHITNIDLIYKIASIEYFDKNELVENYDPVYAEKKADKWKADSSVHDFFLNTPLKDYLGFEITSSIDLNAFTESQRKKMVATMNVLSNLLSGDESNSDLTQYLKEQAEKLMKLTESSTKEPSSST